VIGLLLVNLPFADPSEDFWNGAESGDEVERLLRLKREADEEKNLRQSPIVSRRYDDDVTVQLQQANRNNEFVFHRVSDSESSSTGDEPGVKPFLFFFFTGWQLNGFAEQELLHHTRISAEGEPGVTFFYFLLYAVVSTGFAEPEAATETNKEFWQSRLGESEVVAPEAAKIHPEPVVEPPQQPVVAEIHPEPVVEPPQQPVVEPTAQSVVEPLPWWKFGRKEDSVVEPSQQSVGEPTQQSVMEPTQPSLAVAPEAAKWLKFRKIHPEPPPPVVEPTPPVVEPKPPVVEPPVVEPPLVVEPEPSVVESPKSGVLLFVCYFAEPHFVVFVILGKKKKKKKKRAKKSYTPIMTTLRRAAEELERKQTKAFEDEKERIRRRRVAQDHEAALAEALERSESAARMQREREQEVLNEEMERLQVVERKRVRVARNRAEKERLDLMQEERLARKREEKERQKAAELHNSEEVARANEEYAAKKLEHEADLNQLQAEEQHILAEMEAAQELQKSIVAAYDAAKHDFDNVEAEHRATLARLMQQQQSQEQAKTKKTKRKNKRSKKERDQRRAENFAVAAPVVGLLFFCVSAFSGKPLSFVVKQMSLLCQSWPLVCFVFLCVCVFWQTFEFCGETVRMGYSVDVPEDDGESSDDLLFDPKFTPGEFPDEQKSPDVSSPRPNKPGHKSTRACQFNVGGTLGLDSSSPPVCIFTLIPLQHLVSEMCIQWV